MHDDDHAADRFTIRDDRQDETSASDANFLSDAENLKLEKLNTRVTLIAVLIPCLLVVILAVAYLDIKKRVITTQNSGSMGVQNLSKDLESRFSNLSLKQAKFEEQLQVQAKAVETAAAAMKVDLKKQGDLIERRLAKVPDPATIEKLEKQVQAMTSALSTLRQETSDLSAAFDTFDEELAQKIQLIANGLQGDQGRIQKIETSLQRLDKEKIGKAAMDLAMDLERLSLQEMVKDKLREMDKTLAGVEKTVSGLDRRIDDLAKKITASAMAAPPPQPSPPLTVAPRPEPVPTPSGTGSGGAITEQTIQ